MFISNKCSTRSGLGQFDLDSMYAGAASSCFSIVVQACWYKDLRFKVRSEVRLADGAQHSGRQAEALMMWCACCKHYLAQYVLCMHNASRSPRWAALVVPAVLIVLVPTSVHLNALNVLTSRKFGFLGGLRNSWTFCALEVEVISKWIVTLAM